MKYQIKVFCQETFEVKLVKYDYVEQEIVLVGQHLQGTLFDKTELEACYLKPFIDTHIVRICEIED